MIKSSFIQKILRKPSNELTVNDLESFFASEQEESSVLEFKSGGVEIIDIFKEIAAFLNTEGGLLIVGSPKEKRRVNGKKHYTVCQGLPDPSSFHSKDWLYQKIASNISPPPFGIIIVELQYKNGRIFLIDTPQSMNPPHQSNADGKYYIRLDREAKPAPHGIVEALFKNRRVPVLDVNVNSKKFDKNIDRFKINILNKSNIPAEKISFLIEVYFVDKIKTYRPDGTPGYYVVSEVIEEDKKRFTFHHLSDIVLVRMVAIPIDLEVCHNHKEYIIMIGFWCKNADYKYVYITCDSINEIFKLHSSTADNDDEFYNEYNRVLYLHHNM